jgi:hypothetical protein
VEGEGQRGQDPAGPLWSHLAGWDDLLVAVPSADASGLDLEEGWPDHWMVTRRAGGDEVSCPVRDLARMPGREGGPVRWFSWRRGQRHRPGLQYLVSTGRHHGAEGMEEARVLLALDFAGDLIDVVSQPLRLRFTAVGKSRVHTPDFLAVTRSGTWLIDVRPEPLIRDGDRESFAAAAEVAVACGWRYAVAARWRSMSLRLWTRCPRSAGRWLIRWGCGRGCSPRPGGRVPGSGRSLRPAAASRWPALSCCT